MWKQEDQEFENILNYTENIGPASIIWHPVSKNWKQNKNFRNSEKEI